MSDKPYLTILRNEFDGEDQSFILRLRSDLIWDKAAFLRLVTAMEQCCVDLEGTQKFDRWLAEGFWYFAWFVREWASHESFPRVFSSEYYEGAFNLLFDLSFYFFSGDHPYTDRCFPFFTENPN